MKAISACLCGVNCKYDGKNNQHDQLVGKEDEYLLICPELEAGMDIPRPAIELIGKVVSNTYDDVVSGQIKVQDAKGNDYSAMVVEGAHIVLNRILSKGVKTVVLKDGSPSCGSSFIHDGSFLKQHVVGEGILAALLKKHGIKVECEKTLGILD